MKKKFKLWLLTEQLGAPSEIWIQRQIERFDSMETLSITWADNRETPGKDDVHLMSKPSASLNDLGANRWLFRAARVFSGNYYGATWQDISALKELADRRGKPDVMLAHFGHVALRFLPVAQNLGIPLVAHFHGVDISASLKNNKWYRQSLLNSLESFAACVCVGTQQNRTLLKLGLHTDNIQLIPCGVPTEEFKPRPHSERTNVNFATLCRLVPQKGVDVCLKALAKVPNAHLTIMGDGPEMQNLRDLQEKLGLHDRVTFTGMVPPEKAREYLQETDIFLQHSLDLNGWSEGFGVSPAEAASMEIPVIVSAAGGLLDQAVDGVTGIVVPQNDVDAFAAAMVKLQNDPALRKQMGKAGREHMIQNFDTGNQVRKLEQVLIKAIGA